MTKPEDMTFRARRALLEKCAKIGRHEIVVSEVRFEVDPRVFSPRFFESTHIFSELLSITATKRFLEIGTGCGALAVLAALRGAQAVVATDISPAAVANARRNVALHDVGDVVRVVESNVYEGLAAGSRFDTIFWNAPWLFVPKGYRPGSILEHAICDPGYASIRRFFTGAAAHLSKDGRVLIGLGSFGDIDHVLAVANDAGLEHLGCEALASPTQSGVEFSLHNFRVPRAVAPGEPN
jgi:release factor glutamine methyltransferase